MPVMTVYVAVAGTPLRGGGYSNFGHMWFSVNNGSGERSYGFHPTIGLTPIGPGHVSFNDNNDYLSVDYQKSFFVTQSQYDSLVSFGNNPTGFAFSLFYNGLSNSCVDFVYRGLGAILDHPVGGYEGNILPGTNIDEPRFNAILRELETRNAVDPPPLPERGDPSTVGAITVSVDKHQTESLLGHSFEGTRDDVNEITDAINSGSLTAKFDFAPTEGVARFLAPSDTASIDKLVLSANEDSLAASVVENNELERITQFAGTDDRRIDQFFNPPDTPSVSIRVVEHAPDGEEEFKIDKGQNGAISDFFYQHGSTTADLGSLGATLGSQIGSILAGDHNSVVARVAAGTLIGTLGQELGKLLQFGSIVSPLTAYSWNDSAATRSGTEFDNAETAAARDLRADFTGALRPPPRATCARTSPALSPDKSPGC